MKGKISSTTGRKRLATLWFLGGGMLFAVLVLQSVTGKYDPRVDEAWGWLLPTLMPSLSLIIGVLVAHAVAPRDRERLVDPYIFWLAFGLSAAYLAAVAFTVLVQPFVSMDPLELLKRSSLWLGPLQGLVAATLGVFFTKGEPAKR